MQVTIGRIVLYRSRTGNYDCPAIVTATVETLNPKGVQAGHVPALTADDRVHLTVFTPGKPGLREDAEDFEVESEHGRSENVAGCYQEHDIPFEPNSATWSDVSPATWRWPTPVVPGGPSA